MKRLLSVSIVLLSVYSVFAYEDADITNANFLASENLASENIIVDRSQSPEKYNLDAKILRQEVIAMALKIKGITLPDNSTCKGYYSDTKNNDWVCRVIEMAADNGMITRENLKARPQDMITRIEALAILSRSMDFEGPESHEFTSWIDQKMIQWQRDLVNKVFWVNGGGIDSFSYKMMKKEYSNEKATRGDVFYILRQLFMDKNMDQIAQEAIITPKVDSGYIGPIEVIDTKSDCYLSNEEPLKQVEWADLTKIAQRICDSSEHEKYSQRIGQLFQDMKNGKITQGYGGIRENTDSVLVWDKKMGNSFITIERSQSYGYPGWSDFSIFPFYTVQSYTLYHGFILKQSYGVPHIMKKSLEKAALLAYLKETKSSQSLEDFILRYASEDGISVTFPQNILIFLDTFAKNYATKNILRGLSTCSTTQDEMDMSFHQCILEVSEKLFLVQMMDSFNPPKDIRISIFHFPFTATQFYINDNVYYQNMENNGKMFQKDIYFVPGRSINQMLSLGDANLDGYDDLILSDDKAIPSLSNFYLFDTETGMFDSSPYYGNAKG